MYQLYVWYCVLFMIAFSNDYEFYIIENDRYVSMDLSVKRYYGLSTEVQKIILNKHGTWLSVVAGTKYPNCRLHGHNRSFDRILLAIFLVRLTRY